MFSLSYSSLNYVKCKDALVTVVVDHRPLIGRVLFFMAHGGARQPPGPLSCERNANGEA